MKNKGFTVVEMLSAFTLSSIIIIILFQLIINLKEIYSSSGIKTELLNKQYLMTNKIYSDLNEKQIVSIDSCINMEKCISFTYSDGIVKNLEIDEENKTIKYDNYIVKLNSYTNFGNIIIDFDGTSEQNKIVNINVPIYNDQIKDTNFGINIVYPYNNQTVANNTNYNYKINGITVPSSENTPTMENPVTYTGLGATGNIYIKQNDTTLATINVQGHDPLMCANDICDYIDYENNVIVRYIKKYTFTGSESFSGPNTPSWVANNTETTKGTYWANNSILGSYPDNIIIGNSVGFCTHFPLGSNSAYNKNDTLRYYPYGASNPPYLSFRIPIDTDMNAWTTEQYNAGTPLIAYYVLIDPEYEEISLPGISTFTDITSLTITDGNIESTIE